MTRGGRRTFTFPGRSKRGYAVWVLNLSQWRTSLLEASQLHKSKGTAQCAASLHSQYYFNFCDPVNIRFGEANYNEMSSHLRGIGSNDPQRLG